MKTHTSTNTRLAAAMRVATVRLDAASRRILFGSLAMLLAAVCWGGMFPVAKATLAYVDPFFMTLIRYGLTAVVMALILWRVEGRAALRPEGRAWPLFFFGSAGFCGFGLFVFTGLRASTPSHGAILVALMPLLTALITAASSRQLPARHTRISMALALLGVALVVSNGSPATLLQSNSAGADALILLGVLSWVIYTLGGRSFPAWSPLRYSTLTVIFGVIGVALCTLLASLSGMAHPPSMKALANTLPHFVYIVIFASVVAVLAWNEGVRRIGPVNGVLFINCVPITAFGIQVLQGVAFSPLEYLGATLVTVALLINNLLQRHAASPAPRASAKCLHGA